MPETCVKCTVNNNESFTYKNNQNQNLVLFFGKLHVYCLCEIFHWTFTLNSLRSISPFFVYIAFALKDAILFEFASVMLYCFEKIFARV